MLNKLIGLIVIVVSLLMIAAIWICWAPFCIYSGKAHKVHAICIMLHKGVMQQIENRNQVADEIVRDAVSNIISLFNIDSLAISFFSKL